MNEESFVAEPIQSLATGPDLDWSSNLRKALAALNEEHVLLMMDDAPLSGPVQTSAFNALYERFRECEMNYLNLKATPLPWQKVGDSLVLSLPKGLQYRTALVPAIWRKRVLDDLLVDGESAWEFEIQGSERSDRYGGFFVTRARFFEWVHCVVKGKLDRRALSHLTEAGDLSYVTFPVMTRTEYAKTRVNEMRSCLFKALVPPPFRRRVRARVLALSKMLR